MANIHNSGKRMPVILDHTSEKSWIDISMPLTEAMKLLVPCPSEFLKAHTISPLINSRTSDRNTPDVIKPHVYQADNLLF
jgi:putative SOS response-associated peptidase YedK